MSKRQSEEDTIFELQVHCTELYENEVYTKVLRVMKSEYIPSIEYFRKLIERELDIPRVCQLSLSAAGVPLDPLETMEECCLSHRLFKDPNPITLHYYTTSLNLIELDTLLNEIDSAMVQERIVYLDSLFQRLTRFLRQVNWVSKEATGTKLYINHSGFLEKLKNSLVFQTKFFSKIYENKTKDRQALLSIMRCIEATLRFIWCFGGGWEDCLIIAKYDFLGIILRIFNIANEVFALHTSIGETGDLLFSCYGLFQMVVEQKSIAISLGNNDKFLSILKDALLCKYFYWGTFERCLHSLIIFCISIHSPGHANIYRSGIYTEILNHFVSIRISKFDNTLCRIHYNVCLVTLNILKSPNLKFIRDLADKASRLLENFLKNISVENIVQYESIHNTSWNIIEYFVSFFFVPINSILGNIMYQTEGVYKILVSRYFRVADLILEVIFRQEKHRQQVLAEKLLDLLVIAHWRRGGIYSKLRTYFPNNYIPVPSLHDIAAISAFCAGLGDYSKLIHS